jgi:hypothetical protein
MPRDMDEIEDLEPASSTGSTDVAAAASKDVADAPAASSTATDANAEGSPLSVVRDVLAESRKTDATASSAEGEEEGRKPGEAAAPEDYSDVPFHKHPRFQQLLRDKKEATVDAVRYRNVQRFLDDNGVEAQEAVNALEVAALAKSNPAEAWKRLKPWLQDLLVAAGEVLPQDLQQRVQAGELSQEAAYEVSRSRATVTSVEKQRSFEQQQADRRREMEAGAAVTGAAEAWEADRRAKDPNFDAKLNPLVREVAFLQATEGKPATAEGVRDQLQRAYKAVNAGFVPPVVATPRPQVRPAIRPVTGGQVAGQAKPEPNSVLDIVRANRRAG